MKIFPFILTLCFAWPDYGLGQQLFLSYEPSKISKNIRSIVKAMAKENELHTEQVGYAGAKTIQYQRFEQLLKEATLEEWLELSEHPNPVVRAYAFWGLAKMQYKHLESIFLDHAAEEVSIYFIQGCFAFNLPFTDFMNMVVLQPGFDLDCKKLDHAVLGKMEVRRQLLDKARN